MISIFRKKRKTDYYIPANLTPEEKKAVQEIIEKARNDDGIPRIPRTHGKGHGMRGMDRNLQGLVSR